MELRIYDKPRLRTSKLLVIHNHFYMVRWYEQGMAALLIKLTI